MRREITIISSLPIKVVYNTNPGNVSGRKQLAVWYGRYRDKTWHAAANTITNHSELYSKVLNSVNRNASNEMSEYQHDKIRSMLCNKPHEITRFSHSSSAVVRVFCPVVFKIILSMAYVVFTKAVDVKIQGTAAN